MQQKLDSLCEQVNNVKNQPVNEESSAEKSAEFPFNSSESDQIKFIDKEEDTKEIPFMAENILYDMDSTTSPSSSDSDCSPTVRPQPALLHQVQGKTDPSTTGNPLREISPNLTPNNVPSGRQKLSSGGEDSRRGRRLAHHAARPIKDSTSRRRWS